MFLAFLIRVPLSHCHHHHLGPRPNTPVVHFRPILSANGIIIKQAKKATVDRLGLVPRRRIRVIRATTHFEFAYLESERLQRTYFSAAKSQTAAKASLRVENQETRAGLSRTCLTPLKTPDFTVDSFSCSKLSFLHISATALLVCFCRPPRWRGLWQSDKFHEAGRKELAHVPTLRLKGSKTPKRTSWALKCASLQPSSEPVQRLSASLEPV